MKAGTDTTYLKPWKPVHNHPNHSHEFTFDPGEFVFNESEVVTQLFYHFSRGVPSRTASEVESYNG